MLCRHHGLQASAAGQLWDANFVLPIVFLSSSSKTGGRVCNSLYFSPDDGRSSLSSTSKPNEEILLNFWDRKRRKRIRGWEKASPLHPSCPWTWKGKRGPLHSSVPQGSVEPLRAELGGVSSGRPDLSKGFPASTGGPEAESCCRASRDHYCDMPRARGKSLTYQVPWKSPGSRT